MCCPLVFECSVGIGGFVIGLGQISFFFSMYATHIKHFLDNISCYINKILSEFYIFTLSLSSSPFH